MSVIVDQVVSRCFHPKFSKKVSLVVQIIFAPLLILPDEIIHAFYMENDLLRSLKIRGLQGDQELQFDDLTEEEKQKITKFYDGIMASNTRKLIYMAREAGIQLCLQVVI